jgi:Zn-dependent peptidase ImmA (M78 family)
MPDFKLHQRLHRQRRGRRKPVTILNQAELATYFDVAESAVKTSLQAAGWHYHEDANGALWASPQDKRKSDQP